MAVDCCCVFNLAILSVLQTPATSPRAETLKGMLSLKRDYVVCFLDVNQWMNVPQSCCPRSQ